MKVSPPTGGAALPRTQSWLLATAAGAAIAILGGLIGPGGAEFRLPVLIGVFGFVATSCPSGLQAGTQPYNRAFSDQK